MYGLVNQAISGFLIENYGIDKWNEILVKSKVENGIFLNNQMYDDSVTFNLAITSADLLAIPLRNILIGFGKYWIFKTGAEKYGHLMKSGGADFISFMKNLPNFHTRVMLLYPEIKPPEFIIEIKDDNEILLNYYSTRTGLTDFMEGLILGLGEYFKVVIEISNIQHKDAINDYDIFLIKILS